MTTKYKVKRKVFIAGQLLYWKTRTGWIECECAEWPSTAKKLKYVRVKLNGRFYSVKRKLIATPREYAQLRKQK